MAPDLGFSIADESPILPRNMIAKKRTCMTARAFEDDAEVFTSRDSAALQEHVAGLIGRRVRFEPLCGTGFEARIRSDDLARAQILRADLPYGLRFFTEDTQDNLTIVFIEAGAVSFHSRATRLDGSAGGAVAVNTATMDHGTCREGTRLTIFTVRIAEIAQRLEAMSCCRTAGRLEIAARIEPDDPAGLSLKALVTMAADALRRQNGLAAAPQTSGLLRDAIVAMALEHLPNSYASARGRSTPEPAPWQIRRAIDYIDAHLRETLTVLDVALAVGMSLRSLQEGFRRYRQTSPHEYIKAEKLSGARAELLDPRSRRSIEDVARDWGFTNRGHFATQYRRVYGELPSETRRAR